MPNEANSSYDKSHIFLVRVWPEEIEAGSKRWCGKVQHVLKGEANAFCDWQTLVAHLTAALPPLHDPLDSSDQDGPQAQA